jgi:hypothetical protein
MKLLLSEAEISTCVEVYNKVFCGEEECEATIKGNTVVFEPENDINEIMEIIS